MVLLERLMHKHCMNKKGGQVVEDDRESEVFHLPVRSPMQVISPLWLDLNTSLNLQDTVLLFLAGFQPHILLIWQ